jgi:hypothetical protein
MTRSEVRRLIVSQRPLADTTLHEGLRCPCCGRGLNPISFADSFVFHCRNGHQYLLRDLVEARDRSLRWGLERLVEDWEAHFKTLWATAQDAGRNGYSGIADIFFRQTRSVAARIQAIRSYLPWTRDRGSDQDSTQA